MTWSELIIATRAISDPVERYQIALKAFSEARKRAGETISRDLGARELPIILTAEILGIDKGGLSRQLRGNFAIPNDALVKLCYNVVNKSITQVLFEERGEVVLSRTLSVALGLLRNKGLSARSRVLAYAKRLYDEAVAKGRTSVNLSVHEVLRLRLSEMAEDRDILALDICGRQVPNAVRKSLITLFDRDNYRGALNSLLYFALCNGTTIDGIMVQNPVLYSKIRYYHSPIGQTENNQEIRKIASLYYDLPKEERELLLVYILSRRWEQC